jgi:hypothetical protein
MNAVQPGISQEALAMITCNNPVGNFDLNCGYSNPLFYQGYETNFPSQDTSQPHLQFNSGSFQSPANQDDGMQQQHLPASNYSRTAFEDFGGPSMMPPPPLSHPSYNGGQFGTMPIPSAAGGLLAALNDEAFWKHVFQHKPMVITNQNDIGDLSKLLPALEQKAASGGKSFVSAACCIPQFP